MPLRPVAGCVILPLCHVERNCILPLRAVWASHVLPLRHVPSDFVLPQGSVVLGRGQAYRCVRYCEIPLCQAAVSGDVQSYSVRPLRRVVQYQTLTDLAVPLRWIVFRQTELHRAAKLHVMGPSLIPPLGFVRCCDAAELR